MWDPDTGFTVGAGVGALVWAGFGIDLGVGMSVWIAWLELL